ALHGLLESLDPESSYMSQAEYADFKKHKSASGAVGLTVSKRFGYAAVVSVLPGSPADHAGIKSGDILEAVGGKTSRDLSVAEVRSMLTGDVGSSVELAVVKPPKAEPEKITVQRANLTVPPVAWRMVDASTGYIQPIAFTKGRTQEIANAMKALQKQGATKYVLDLRYDGMGEPEEGVATANLFMDHGVIATLEGQKYPKQQYVAQAAKTVSQAPVAVLVNGGTAGPAEIVAAALLGNARGDVVGNKTFGVGSIQKTMELPDGSALLLSVAKYYAPGGKAIQDAAVTPNVLVSNEDDLAALASEDSDGSDVNTDQSNSKREPAAPKQDLQLQRALEVLKSKHV
ncbi:MAG: PDZ domain-containing protein, partial [Acidobacteriales bacterium]|nr:PDZ domain-containing protein [Terriglobales bacterium]